MQSQPQHQVVGVAEVTQVITHVQEQTLSKVGLQRQHLVEALHVIPAVQQGLCAAVYTQLSDVEEEINGILTYDRKVNKAGRELLNNINDRLYFEHEAYTKNYDRRVEEDIAAGEAGGDPFEE